MDVRIRLFYSINQSLSLSLYKMFSRNINDVLAEIQRIVYAQPSESVLSQWNPVFAKFRAFEIEVLNGHYWNKSPESIEYDRWMLLYSSINRLIAYPTPEHDWQQDIVDVYMGAPVGISVDHIQIVPIEEEEEAGCWKQFDDSDTDTDSDYEETKEEPRPPIRMITIQ